jgi:hypothetical protein
MGQGDEGSLISEEAIADVLEADHPGARISIVLGLQIRAEWAIRDGSRLGREEIIQRGQSPSHR